MEAYLVILGSLITVISGLATGYFTQKWQRDKETEQWQRQQTLEIEKLNREDRKQRRDQLIDAYNNSILFLAKGLAEIEPYYQDDEEYDSREFREKLHSFRQKQENYFAEAQKYMWLVAVNLSGFDDAEIENYRTYLNTFASSPDASYAKELRKILIDLASKDSRLKDNDLNKTKQLDSNSTNLLTS